MHITFSHPLSATITIESPVLFARTQRTPVLFQAELGAHDYAQLVADGGVVELWSKFGSDAAHVQGEWVAQPFVDGARSGSGSGSGAPPGVDLCGSAAPATDDDDGARGCKTLCLAASFPPLGAAGRVKRAYTYRVVYPSGKVKWLGTHTTNGFITLEAPPVESALHGIMPLGGWCFNASQTALFQEFKDEVSDVEVVALRKAEALRMWTFGKDGLVNNLTDAAVLFIAPKASQNLSALCPTYVLVASPGIALSVSSFNGVVTASGSGTIQLLAKDEDQDAVEFIRRVAEHSHIHDWKIIGSNNKNQSVILATNSVPMHGTIISLWPSTHLSQSIELDVAQLEIHDAEEIAVFPTGAKSVHVLAIQQGPGEKQRIPIAFSDASRDFAIAPVHRLHRPYNSLSRTEWGLALLTSHKRLNAPAAWDADAIPTPPASPPAPRHAEVSLGAAAILLQEDADEEPHQLFSRLDSLATDDLDAIQGAQIGDRFQERVEGTAAVADPAQRIMLDSESDAPDVDNSHRRASVIHLHDAIGGGLHGGPRIHPFIQFALATLEAALRIFLLLVLYWVHRAHALGESLHPDRAAPAQSKDARSASGAGEDPGHAGDAGRRSIPLREITLEQGDDEAGVQQGDMAHRAPPAPPPKRDAADEGADALAPSLENEGGPVPAPAPGQGAHAFCAEVYPPDGAEACADIVFLPVPLPGGDAYANAPPHNARGALYAALRAAVGVAGGETRGPRAREVAPQLLVSIWHLGRSAHAAEGAAPPASAAELPMCGTAYLLRCTLGAGDGGNIVRVAFPEAQST